MKNILKLIEESSNYQNYSFAKLFNQIIINKVQDYDNLNEDKKECLKSFLEDVSKGGCQSGMISDFIYHADCKTFYIAHIDDLEEFKEEYEEQIGINIENRQKLPHYTFMCWLTFDEYCYNIYTNLFEN